VEPAAPARGPESPVRERSGLGAFRLSVSCFCRLFFLASKAKRARTSPTNSKLQSPDGRRVILRGGWDQVWILERGQNTPARPRFAAGLQQLGEISSQVYVPLAACTEGSGRR
jgi:hypothetical protein